MSSIAMKESRKNSDRSVRDIITSARTVHTQYQGRVGAAGAIAMSFLSGLLLWLCFTPVAAAPLAWIAPVPLLLLVRIEQRTSRMYLAVYAGALISQLAMLQWMRLGDPTMYIAWGALSAYLAFYTVAFVALSRIAVHRWSVPLVLAAPMIWVGAEYLRAHLMTGFAWYFLGHSQYRWLELIQISDLVGAYGVSLVILMSASALTLVIPHQWLIRMRLVAPSSGPTTASGLTLSQLIQVTATIAVFATTLGYGYVRRAQADFKPGPRVALIQGNYVASLREPPHDPYEVFMNHLRLNALAVREHPDFIVWPESMFPWPVMSASPELSDDQLTEMAPGVKPEAWQDTTVRSILIEESLRSGAALILGSNTIEATPEGLHPHNSALFVRPTDGLAGQYDKIHLVPFGEYIPLRDVIPLMRAFSPYRDSGGLDAGKGMTVFEHKNWRVAPVICFEDTVPHLVRSVVAAGSDGDQGKPVDVIVNMTNDGWFHGSSELDQHLITAAFRAVECRTPVARAVNTGISAIIDGDGAIIEPDVFIDGDARKNSHLPPRTTSRDPKTGAWHKQLNAVVIDTVPLDSRRSLYVRYGDWFAMLCAAAMLFTALSMAIPRKAAVQAERSPG